MSIRGFELSVLIKFFLIFQMIQSFAKKIFCENFQFENYLKNSTIIRNSIILLVLLSKVKVKLVTIVEGNPKAPFSIGTTLRCRRGHNPFFFWISPLYPMYLIMLSVKQGGIKYFLFLRLWYDSTWDRIPVSQTTGKHSTH